MGKKPAELEREIAEHRRAMSRKRYDLEQRIRADLHDARDAASHEISERTRINQYAQERPLATVATAFGVGVLLGAVSDSRGSPRRDYDRRPSRSEYGHDYDRGGDGLLGGLLAGITAPLGNTIQDELRTTVREFLRRDDEPRPGGTEWAKQPHLDGI